MMGIRSVAAGLVLVACALAMVCGAAAGQDEGRAFANEEVVRTIDLTEHVVVVTSEITVLSLASGAREYAIAMEENMAEALAHIEAADDKERPLEVTEAAAINGIQLFTVQLSKALKKGRSTTITVTCHLTHVQTPFPERLVQGARQLVVFEGNTFVTSPYTTQSQTTTVRLPSARVESYTKEQPASKSGDTITYGPYEDLQAFARADLRLHYENLTPFSTAAWVEREVEVSHWGNVAVEEHYEVHNTGAELKGGFSRLDYQMKMARAGSFQKLMCHIPREATGLYYRDIIGNISTSAVRQTAAQLEMEISARFPVFGGWRTQWYQGYNQPLGTAVSVNDDGSYSLKVGFGPSLVGVPVDDLEVKFVLPEGAGDIKVEAPFPVDESRSTRFTYFDTPLSGRPVISLKTGNFVDAADGVVTVTYSMPPLYMLREPLMIVGAFFVLFLSYSLLSRVNLSLK